jgi:hypothetical protein
MHSMEKYLALDPFALRRGEHSDVNVNDPYEVRHVAQEWGVDEVLLTRAAERAGLTTRAMQAHLSR